MSKQGQNDINLRRSWNIVASHYAKRYHISMEDVHYGPLCPGESRLGLLGNINGKRVLDLGCGGGQNAIALARLGADVTAVDFSEKQISIAEEIAKEAGYKIDFKRGDISDIGAIPSASFDLALSACAIAFVEDMAATFDGVFRVLKPGGKFVLSDMNPLQYILDENGHGVEFNSPYPFEPILVRWRWDFEQLKENPKFKHYVRSIPFYHNALVKAGFKVSQIIEPASTLDTPHRGFSDEIIREYPYIAKNLPITFIFVCEK